jgi:predicted acetyltransferase
MDVELRAVSIEELPAFLWADSTGFGHAVDRARRNMAAWELDRTVAAFERDRIVGVSRNYSFELTLPGGALVPAAGVSDVSVLPTHRRRGLLRTMMDRLLDDAVAHGECVAMLTASEGGIYGRFGFGVTIRSCSVEIDTVAAEFPEPAPVGTLRLVELEEARALEPEIFDRARRVQPGAVSRFDPWWTDEQFHTEMGARFDVVFESPEGSLDGYLTYGIRQQWGTGGPNHRLAVSDLVAVTPVASNALWRYACEVDLVRTVFAHNAPIDLVVGWSMTSPRAARINDVRDSLWTRIVDVPTALSARTYAMDGSLVLEVRDSLRPDGDADGRFALTGGPHGATAGATTADPELVMDIASLSAAWLGGVPFSTLARAGRIDEVVAGALARADAMFASSPLPLAMTWF